MEFWGIEIKPGKPVTCTPEDGIYFHISQAALGESPKGGKGNNERIMVKIAVGKKTEVVIGTLVQGKCDQFPLDLIFDHEFTISHTGTSCHVFLSGYKSDTVQDDDSDMGDSEAESDEEEVPTPVPVPTKVQGKADTKGAKAEKAAEKVISSQVVKAANQVQKEVTKKEVAKKEDKKKAIGGAKVEPPKDDSDDEEEDSDDDDDDDDEDDDEDNESDDDDEMGEEFSDMDDSDEDSSDEEETPKTGDKKRPGLTGSIAVPAGSKKMKTGTPFAVKPVSNKHEKALATPTTPSTMKGQQNAKKFSAKKSPGSNNQKSRR